MERSEAVRDAFVAFSRTSLAAAMPGPIGLPAPKMAPR